MQDEQADYPLAPENMKVEDRLLSKHQRELHRHYIDGLKVRMPLHLSKYLFFVNLECRTASDGEQTVRMLTQNV